MSMAWLLIILLLVVVLVGGLPRWGTHPYGYYPSGIVGILLVVVIILLLLGRF